MAWYAHDDFALFTPKAPIYPFRANSEKQLPRFPAINLRSRKRPSSSAQLHPRAACVHVPISISFRFLIPFPCKSRQNGQTYRGWRRALLPGEASGLQGQCASCDGRRGGGFHWHWLVYLCLLGAWVSGFIPFVCSFSGIEHKDVPYYGIKNHQNFQHAR